MEVGVLPPPITVDVIRNPLAIRIPNGGKGELRLGICLVGIRGPGELDSLGLWFGKELG